MPDLLYLFSSNARPLYARDVEVVAGLPAGCVFKFRYNEGYVQAAIKDRWRADTLKTHQGVVVFSMQHPAKYHPAVLIPVRQVEVVRTWVDGTTYLVEFRLDRYAPVAGGSNKEGSTIRKFNDELGAVLAENRPDTGVSAVLAPAVYDEWPAFDGVDGNHPKDWEVVVSSLARTGVFANHRHVRISGVQGADGESVEAANGVFHLVGGRTYSLALSHHQVDDIAAVEWLAVASDDDVIEIVSSSRVPIASKYDSMTVLFKAVTTTAATRTTITVAPEKADSGPPLEISVQVDPPQVRRAVTTLASAAGGFLLAVPGLFDDIPAAPWGILIAATGAAIVAGLSWFGLSPLKAS